MKVTMTPNTTNICILAAEAEKVGIRKGRFETVEHFVRRVERMTYAAVKDHETLVRVHDFGGSSGEEM